MPTRPNYQDLLNSASTAAETELNKIVSGAIKVLYPDIATKIVEHIIEAATARTFLRLENEGAKRQRIEAVDVLRPNLCGACVELLDPKSGPVIATIGQKDYNVPGSTELAERALFLGWASRVVELGHGSIHQTLWPTRQDEDDPRFVLIAELHASVAARYPLGIAESLYQAIGALHAGDDRDAELTLKDLAQAEMASAMNEKAAGVLGALKVLVDPELDEERVLKEIKTWTLEDLVQVEGWAEAAFKVRTTEAGSPPVPDVVRALTQELAE